MIDKSARQYYANGQLVKPTRHGLRPGYRGDDANKAREARSKEAKSSKPSGGGNPFSNQGSGDDNPNCWMDGKPSLSVLPHDKRQ